MRKGIWLLASLSMLGGCGQKYWFNDDIDLVFDLFAVPFGGKRVDLINTPYVEGAPVHFWAATLKDSGFDGFSLRSADESVFQLGEFDSFVDDASDFAILGTDAFATGAGTTSIELVDPDGDAVYGIDVEVRRPDHVELHAAGPLYVDGSFPTETARPKIVDGGLATFEVRYFDGGTRLHGNSVLTAKAGANTGVTVEQSWFFENREWLQLSPNAAGPDSVPISVNGVDLPPVEIDVVPAETVTDVRLFAERETRDADNGDPLVVLCQAFDAESDPVFGVECLWDLDGEAETGAGDLYRYTFDKGDENELAAHVGDLADTVTIHGEGYVDSSNNIGCRSVGGAASGGLALLGAIGAVQVRRRRR